MDPTFPLAPVANFVAIVLVLLPLFYTSIRSGSWNIAVTSFSIWIAIGCVMTGVNAIVWSDNVRDVAPVWCDIATHLNYAARIADRACSFLMTRSLYRISLSELNIPSSRRSHGRVLSELGWTLGLPTLTMFLYYVVQEHRYQIIEEEGCSPTPALSGLSILLLEIPNLILPIISALFYCPYIFWSSYKRSKQTCKSAHYETLVLSGIYYRIMALGCVDAMLTLPISIYMFISDVLPLPKSFYPGWDAVHAQFSVIPTFPASEWNKDLASVIHSRWVLWTNPIVAFAFFALFGLTEEARTNYRKTLWEVTGISMFGTKKASQPANPVFSEMRFGSSGNRNGAITDSSSITVNDAERPPAHVKLVQIETINTCSFEFSTTVEEGTLSMSGEQDPTGEEGNKFNL